MKHKKLAALVTTMTLALSSLLSQAAMAQNWPQQESAYLPSSQSPQWVESANIAPQTAVPAPAPQYYGQPAPYAGSYGQQPMPSYPQAPYAPYPNGYPNAYQQGYPQNNAWQGMPTMPYPQYGGNQGWGNNWPNMNNFNMSPRMPSMPGGGMPNMPSFDMPSPSFEMPTMSMPFFN